MALVVAATFGTSPGQAQSVLPRPGGLPLPVPGHPVPLPTPVPPPLPVGSDLKGFADLHTHPATHFSFGRNGAPEGLFWGNPGMKYEDGLRTVTSDLRACAGSGDPTLVGTISHGTGPDFDPVRHMTHQLTVQALDSSTGYSHAPTGGPGFQSWPNARSLSTTGSGKFSLE